MSPKTGLRKKFKDAVIGKPHDLKDRKIFQHLSLIAFFAWVGLGADGLSSSCYGPQEAFLALGSHTYLSIFVAIATVITIFVLCASYSQIIELFPSGGGGYLVATKLLSPSLGMISGCALLIDYVLTITVSVASGADAIFSLLPPQFYHYKLICAVFVILGLIVINMRGAKESIMVLLPVFIIFLITHAFIIIYALSVNVTHVAGIAQATAIDTKSALGEVGFWGVAFLILRAYSMGAGTFTGIEAVSNGMSVLREPRIKTAKHTMAYMGFSLAFVVMGLMMAYLFYNVGHVTGKTLNAVFFEQATKLWNPNVGYVFVMVALVAEAAILFVAAQTGFLDGPRVLGNMALDRWFPTKFSVLSDRLVTQNGILIMGILALGMMLLAHGSVRFLVVLYSINVFITFVLSQAGMVRHWWRTRKTVQSWFSKLLINGFGFIMSGFILLSMFIFKFFEGGWITLLITGALVALAIAIKKHYLATAKLLHRLNDLVIAVESSSGEVFPAGVAGQVGEIKFDPKAKTAVLLVNGFNGIGLHTLFGILRKFSGQFKNFIFVQVGIVDSGNFKGTQEMDHLQQHVKDDLKRYVDFMTKHGFYAEAISVTAVDVVEEVGKLAPKILERFPSAIFFGGQLVFPVDTFLLRLLHNHIVFALQKLLYREGILFVILPIRV